MKFFKKVWKGWLKIGKAIGHFQSIVLFTIFYFLFLFPIGIAMRYFSDPLKIRNQIIKSNFTEWEHSEEDLIGARKPY